MPSFGEIIDSLHELFDELMSCDLVEKKDIPKKVHQKGIYVFYENNRPIYVGRSRDIAKRIRRHSRPSSKHNSASFAFLLAKEQAKVNGMNLKRTRKNLEADPLFNEIFMKQKKRISKMLIRTVQIENSETQAIFEIYASKELKTKYNDFDTH